MVLLGYKVELLQGGRTYGAALVKPVFKLAEHVVPVDRVALVLVGFAEAPASFRVPDGFTQTGVEEIQHFVVLEHERERAIETAPGAVARGPLAESDLAVLARAGGS